MQGTFNCERTVLVVARTVTSTGRLLEALRFFRDDFRVKPVFTVNDTSRYSAGAHELLTASGVEEIVPWDRVGELDYALALSASENIDFSRLRGTTVVLPHGIGFNKWVPDPTTRGTRLAGLPPVEALRTGRVRLVLSHPSQERQLLEACPEIAGSTAVTGDPTYDQLRASLPLRDRYRRKLGLGDRKLVLLSSTWRSESELGAWRTLPLEMLADLPSDEYQVALVMHPNIWAWYGSRVVRNFFDRALDAGLLLIPPERGWHAALVAADVVVGDHGSLSLYSAALGKPLLLSAFGAEHVPGTPVEELGRTAEHLVPGTGLREQVERALAHHDPQRFSGLTDGIFAHVGHAETRLRDLLYSELNLAPPPGEPPLLRPPDVDVTPQPVTAYDTFTDLSADGHLRIRRFPASARQHDVAAEAGSIRHLAVEEDERDLHRPHQASVFVRRAPSPAPGARAWAARALESLPGARVTAAATESGCVAAVRRGPVVEVSGSADAMLLASTVYACWLEGDLRDRDIAVHAGETSLRVRLTVS
ncbi:hypothetical protein QFW96_26935 [Saccharopolyspora sp. TS4A08]|uniref:Translation initiation factor 2 n=1 Tax=Saccharopolyspora ipomoeae TaxID=3042027 RepID=A0ABT6PW95_9PSEU|nr:hypothetical protein [Saccharopolyspora sp. TS4A08]MDI2032283.1 hypothetical protein [Saccharopolyspora sp. TS4A08]